MCARALHDCGPGSSATSVTACSVSVANRRLSPPTLQEYADDTHVQKCILLDSMRALTFCRQHTVCGYVQVYATLWSCTGTGNGFLDGGMVDRVGLQPWRNHRQHQQRRLDDRSSDGSSASPAAAPHAVVHLIGRSSPFSGSDDVHSSGVMLLVNVVQKQRLHGQRPAAIWVPTDNASFFESRDHP